uniref:Peptidyl-prolyl cis-trans isomerase n=1 Tax=Sphenodon punctatus TaxID=8508 RepID=A0A8D0GIF3_SPHPU
MAVLLETTLGDLVIDLYTEERPRACLNFLKLCKIKYYNYCLIHNVQKDFIIQTGDTQGTGRGGESVFCKLYGDQARFFEAEKVPRIKHKKKGTVSMVNNGNDQHGSQFLITTGENLDYLNGVHTVFGEVTEGMDVLNKINEAFVDKEFVPFQDIRINHTVILDDPFDDPSGLAIPDRSPEPTKEQLNSGRIGADEEIDDLKGRSVDEVEEILAEKEAKTQAILLEMVGDLPDADIKPPENVLFVCKLNPVTTDEDLEIIFSRFGSIKSCEVIRDWKTSESLCYAFIEFEKEEDCEKAYFKMDNVLIDDRRIHVDFSQSVAKVKWKGKAQSMTLCWMRRRKNPEHVTHTQEKNTRRKNITILMRKRMTRGAKNPRTLTESTKKNVMLASAPWSWNIRSAQCKCVTLASAKSHLIPADCPNKGFFILFVFSVNFTECGERFCFYKSCKM